MMRFVIHWGYGLRLDSVIIMTDGQLLDTIRSGVIFFMITAGTNILFVIRLQSQSGKTFTTSLNGSVSIVCFSAVRHLRSVSVFADNLLNFEESLRDGSSKQSQ